MRRFIKDTFYYIINILTLGKGVERKINGLGIRFPVSYFRFFESDYEKENFIVFKEVIKTGDIIIDIGTHIGLQSVVFAKFAGDNGHVYSFEPTPHTFEVLKQTIRLNHLIGVITPINQAITSESGSADFYSVKVGVSNSLVSYKNTKNLEKITVATTSVDLFAQSYKLKKIDFIKIDVEGVELNVLKGASNTFTTNHPKVLLALHPDAIVANGNTLTDIYNFIDKYNYIIWYKGVNLGKEEFCSQTQLFDVLLK